MSDPFAVLAPFHDAGVVAAADIHIAAALDRLVNGAGSMVVIASALAARGPRLGHVCVDLEHVASTVAVDRDISHYEESGPLPWPDPDAWLAALRASALVRARAGGAPLVLDGPRLYLERYWYYERAVAEDLTRRATTVPGRPAVARAEVLDALLTGAGSQDQRAAVAKALEGTITVIAGGPGTGKTTTIAAMLAALVGDTTSVRIALAAPTGKAAARLGQALTSAASRLPVDLRAALGAIDATTIHRLLGRDPGSASRFLHGPDDPLPHDVIVIDETSMVSLPLMAKLLAAVRADARLVLVGDPDQLASVEAGAVLGDVTGPAESGVVPSPPEQLDLFGAVPSEPRPTSGPLTSRIAILRTSRRFSADSPIGVLATAVRDGNAAAALAVLRDGGDSVEWLPLEDSADVPAALQSRILDVVLATRDAAWAGDAAAALGALDRLRVLCAHRHGGRGVRAWNARIEQWLRLARPTDVVAGWYRGRPVLVTTNDYRNNLFNGDLGVVVDHDGAVRVAFEGSDGPRWLAPAALETVETVHAMTIHKSQGSEFDHAVVILPPPNSPLLSRELLYTALTRARHGVTVVGSAASIETAIGHRVARATGLRDALWHD